MYFDEASHGDWPLVVYEISAGPWSAPELLDEIQRTVANDEALALQAVSSFGFDDLTIFDTLEQTAYALAGAAPDSGVRVTYRYPWSMSQAQADERMRTIIDGADPGPWADVSGIAKSAVNDVLAGVAIDTASAAQSVGETGTQLARALPGMTPWIVAGVIAVVIAIVVTKVA